MGVVWDRRDEKRSSSPLGFHNILTTSKDYNSLANWTKLVLEHKQLHMAPSVGKMTSWRWTGHPRTHIFGARKLGSHWMLQPNYKRPLQHPPPHSPEPCLHFREQYCEGTSSWWNWVQSTCTQWMEVGLTRSKKKESQKKAIVCKALSLSF